MALRIDKQIYKLPSSVTGVLQFKGSWNATTNSPALVSSVGTTGFLYVRLEDLKLERQAMEFLYRDAGHCVLMNPDNYEQEEIPATIMGTSEQFLAEGMRVSVEFFEGRPISVVFPPSMEARVAETAPPMHSGQENTWKEARLENGVQIQVPLFIAPGETVRIDLKTGRYLERVRGERKKGT